jgi:uncharacterized protein YjdB
MFARDCFKVAGLICLVLPFTGCTNNQVGSITVTPATQSLTVGQTIQFTATGIIGHGSHPATSTNVTSEVTWSSSAPGVATVSASGVATALTAGSAVISATLSGSATATAALTVTATGTIGGGGGSTGTALTALAVIPGSQSVASPSQTSQFIAIGTTASGATLDVTTQVSWTSSSNQVATVTPTSGLATGLSQGTTTITAIGANPDGSVVAGSATFTVVNGQSEAVTALSVTPSSVAVSASGQTAQLIALGTSGSTGLELDVTSSPNITWTSSIPTIATVSKAGLVAGASAGSTVISAIWTNPDGTVVSNTATVTVTPTAAPEPLLSLTIIPATITVGNLQDTGNFLAIGTFSTSPTVRDLTNSVNWISSAPDVFPVNTNANPTNEGAPGGIVTAYGNGGAVIIAEATDPTTGSIQTATAEFNCPLVIPTPTQAGSCYPGSEASALLSTVTVYNEGLNTTNWLVTAPSATGTPNVIHCGPGSNAAGLGASVCVATYPVGASIVLTAPAGAGQFGGWSSSCASINPNPSTAAGPNTCTIIPATSSETVGAIFN